MKTFPWLLKNCRLLFVTQHKDKTDDIEGGRLIPE